MEINDNVFNKIIYNYLDLDYPNNLITYENQTNKTVCKIMNNFIDTYKNDFNKKKFILMYQDDIYSLIAYNILKNIQGIYNFNLKIYGKRKNTKKYIKKNEFINFFKLKRIKQKDIVYISCFNPIYKVKNSQILFKELSLNNCYKIIDKFTPSQFDILTEFYSIREETFLKEFKLESVLQFRRFTLNPELFLNQKPDIFKNDYFSKIVEQELNNSKFYLVKLNGEEDDFKLFDYLIKLKEICFYFYDEEKEDFLKLNLNHYVKQANIINNYNSNNYELVESFLKTKMKYSVLRSGEGEEKFWRGLK